MARGGIEVIIAIWSAVYIAIAVREFTFLPFKIFMQNMELCPSRVGFLFGCVMYLLTIPFRLACNADVENNLSMLVMLCFGSYFLFFCR